MTKEQTTTTDLEDVFLTEALEKYKFWKAETRKLETAGKDATKTKEYAEAFRVQLNAFTANES